jgi:S-adenosylmethionine:tRNA ribosyltransferase-isomerase
MNKLSDYDFFLPKELIATTPLPQRGTSRLLALRKEHVSAEHDVFAHIGHYLNPGDVLVINNTKVMKARIYAHKKSGGKVEILLVRPRGFGAWSALINGKGYMPGSTLEIDSGATIEVVRKIDEEPGLYEIRSESDLSEYARVAGEMPIPRYFGRKADANDEIFYQTIFAKDDEWGGVAAPTAGLHFTPELLAELAERNIQVVETTLHVGPGTFLPVRCEDINDHQMHSEFFSLSDEAAKKLNHARQNGHRIIVVGTTAMRVVEQSMQWALERQEQHFSACAGQTAIFIRPGYKFLACDAIITNFHVPKSSLLMLISAVAGRKRILEIYQEAIEKNYRFFSYGDACYFEIRNDTHE